MKRLTVREFRAGFAKLDEPVLVGDGLWLPDASQIEAVAQRMRNTPNRVAIEEQHTRHERLEMERRRLLAEQAARDAILRKLSTTKPRGKMG